jgi:hypothetical protein
MAPEGTDDPVSAIFSKGKREMITSDHKRFYRNGEAFFPKIQNAAFPIQEWSDAVLLPLRASLQDDLDWSKEKQIAEQILEKKKAIFWELDLQFDNLSDSSAFFAHARAVEEFSKFTAAYAAHTFGVCLYRGSAEFSSLLPPSACDEEILQEHDFRLFCADALASYLHRLISFLPESVLPFGFFDASTISSPAYAAQLLSQERFQFLHLGLKGARFPFHGLGFGEDGLGTGWIGDRDCASPYLEVSAAAVCLPSDAYCNPKILGQIDELLLALKSQEVLFRIIPEERLTEEWDGLDRLFVIPESISPQGRRKLQGFAAAGGEIITDIL